MSSHNRYLDSIDLSRLRTPHDHVVNEYFCSVARVRGLQIKPELAQEAIFRHPNKNTWQPRIKGSPTVFFVGD